MDATHTFLEYSSNDFFVDLQDDMCKDQIHEDVPRNETVEE